MKAASRGTVLLLAPGPPVLPNVPDGRDVTNVTAVPWGCVGGTAARALCLCQAPCSTMGKG